MRMGRAQAIIIRENKMLFGYGKIGKRHGHFFIGGGIEEGETPSEAILREIKEEANVSGEIIIQFKDEFLDNHYTFLVDIGDQECTLGYDPEEVGYEKQDKALQKLIWIPLMDIEQFTEIDKNYIKILVKECEECRYSPNWLNVIKENSSQF